ncbi:hypothetical protein RRF57_006315 [Xylaria bambusicola]|uniref:Uncharacterized protein n=1 Tax=Xylaria bambusicola TaxID=326684 RepID=A0AAN7UE32_9PEZI
MARKSVAKLAITKTQAVVSVTIAIFCTLSDSMAAWPGIETFEEFVPTPLTITAGELVTYRLAM